MAIFRSKNKFSIFERQHETKLYELVMDEIANDTRQKGIWGQALVRANGDEKKAEAEYIKLRVESLKDELEIIKQNENEKAIINDELKKHSQKEKQKKNNNQKNNNGFILIMVFLLIITFAFILSAPPSKY